MARGDLLINLVKASVSDDRNAVRSIVEAIIAEERSKQHTILADRLTRAMQTACNGRHPRSSFGQVSHRGRDFVTEITPRKELADMALPDACRTAVDQLIEEQRRATLLRANGVDPRHRVLLIGPPGNGKTSLAEAIAGSLAVQFFVVRYEAMVGSYLGETASRLRRVFDYARTTPCVLFFDEFDAVGKERGDVHETGEIKRVVSSLLMNVDDLPSYTVVIAATNHPELLDRAVWRRFQLRLTLPAPGEHDLTKYFRKFLASDDRRTHSSVSAIARQLGAVSYAEAEEFVLDVRRRHVMEMANAPLKHIIAEQVKLWRGRAQPNARKEQDCNHG